MNPDIQNPFASPQIATEAVAPATSDVEQLRLAYLGHEASIRGIGTLFLFGAAVSGLYAILMLFGLCAIVISSGGLGPLGQWEILFVAGFDALFFAMAAGTFWVGRGLRRVRPQVRTAAGVFCALGLLAIPIGTLINGYFLYLLFGQKGQVVFSPEYQAAIALTPYLRYRTSFIAWALLLLLVLSVAGGLSFLFMSA